MEAAIGFTQQQPATQQVSVEADDQIFARDAAMFGDNRALAIDHDQCGPAELDHQCRHFG